MYSKKDPLQNFLKGSFLCIEYTCVNRFSSKFPDFNYILLLHFALPVQETHANLKSGNAKINANRSLSLGPRIISYNHDISSLSTLLMKVCFPSSEDILQRIIKKRIRLIYDLQAVHCFAFSYKCDYLFK